MTAPRTHSERRAGQGGAGSAMAGSEMSGGEAMARMLAAHEVGPMFGMGGFQLLPFYDAVRRLGLTHHLVNDERSGVFASDAYAKVSGRVGVCDATLGPGATNLVTGLVEALNAGSPLVVIVGDRHRAHSGKNMTQESRQIEILRPAAKEVIRVEVIERIPELVRRAFSLATTGRPGPVVLDVPEDVVHGASSFDEADFRGSPHHRSAPALRVRADAASVEAAARLLRTARRPVLLAGGGVHLSRAAEALQRFAVEQGIPVAHTMSGKGAIACTHRLSAGLFGRYERIANALVQSADCLLVVGCKLGEIATRRYALLPDGVPVVHLDIAAEEFGRVVVPSVALWADAREGILDLSAALSADAAHLRCEREDYILEVAGRMAAWRESAGTRLGSDEVPVNMARLIHELNRNLPDDALLVADGGIAAHWAGLLYDTRRPGRGFVPDRGFAAIGYGLPASIGAKLAAGERPVLGLTGDAGLNMSLGELETARRLGLDLTIAVANGAASDPVKALQDLIYGKEGRPPPGLFETDYARVAEAIGCRGIRVAHPDDIAPALAEALAGGTGPTLIDVPVTREPARMPPGDERRAGS